MKIRVFHASDGDCLLLSSSGTPPRRLLIDGGRKDSYEQNTRALLGKLRKTGGRLDVVCVSHIDDDHISGILRLVEDEVEWRAYEFARSQRPGARPPRAARPPQIGEVWHNGLFELLGDENLPDPQPVLGSVATLLAGSPEPRHRAVAADLADLATGERSSMELSRRLSPGQLRIPLNPRTRGRLMQRKASGRLAAGEKVQLGALRILLLGPSPDDIGRLRVEWRTWLQDSGTVLRKLQAAMIADEERLGALSPGVVVNPFVDQALGEGLASVTAANLASIMLLVEEGTSSALLTGDGVSREILDGLARHKKLDADGRIHVSVLKVQHHGALANVDRDFVSRVTADHYVFCGNGAHHNPELEVVEAIARVRLTGIDAGGPVGPPGPFRFWFTSSPTTPDTSSSGSRPAHMTAVRDLVTRLRREQRGRLSAKFLSRGSVEIAV
jgi:beta-lactamase superfamily II metal-dependent hydrolase